MNIIHSFPLFMIVACLLVSAVSSCLHGKASRILTLCLCGLVCALSAAVLWLGITTGEVTEFMMGHFPHPWGNELRFSIIEPLMAVLFSAVMFFSVMGGRIPLERDLHEGKHHLYYVLVDLLLAALCALCYTNDLFTAYVFIEISTIAACGLLMIREIGRTTLASVRYMIFSLLGSGLFLMGIIFLYGITGHLLMPNLKETVAVLWAAGTYKTPLLISLSMIVLGLGIKSGLCPFHLWMPDTYGYSTPSSAAILSGLVSKGYLFLLIKVIFDVFGTDVFYATGVDDVLFYLGVAGMVWGSVSAIREKEINRMLAYSSAAQIGYIYMGIGLSPVLGIAASVLHIFTHALTKPLLFLASGQLADTVGSKDYNKLRGAALACPVAGVAFAVGAFSMIGIPLTTGFASKYCFALAAFGTDAKTLVAVLALVLSTALNSFYFIRMLIRIYRPAAVEEAAPARHKSGVSYIISAVFFILINLAAGIAAVFLYRLIERGLTIL